MAIYREDIVDIELESGSLHRSFMNRTIGKADNMANRFGVRLFRNGEPVNTESCQVTGIFMAPNGVNIAISGNDVTGKSGNTAWVQLPAACYNVEGQFSLAIRLIGPNAAITGTMRIVDGVVNNTGADDVVVPTSRLPTTDEILAAYEDWQENVVGSVRFDITQSLTDAQKETARSNIGAGNSADLSKAVRWDVTQSLTDAQKERARDNIGAGNSSDISKAVRWDVTQSLTSAQKQRARDNIGASSSQDIDFLGLYIADGYICQDITSD